MIIFNYTSCAYVYWNMTINADKVETETLTLTGPGTKVLPSGHASSELDQLPIQL